MSYGTLILNGDKFDLMPEQVHDDLSHSHNFHVYLGLVLDSLYAQHGSYALALADIGKSMDYTRSELLCTDAPEFSIGLFRDEVEAYNVDDEGADYV
jgi:hypothetical protein